MLTVRHPRGAGAGAGSATITYARRNDDTKVAAARYIRTHHTTITQIRTYINKLRHTYTLAHTYTHTHILYHTCTYVQTHEMNFNQLSHVEYQSE